MCVQREREEEEEARVGNEGDQGENASDSVTLLHSGLIDRWID